MKATMRCNRCHKEIDKGTLCTECIKEVLEGKRKNPMGPLDEMFKDNPELADLFGKFGGKK